MRIIPNSRLRSYRLVLAIGIVILTGSGCATFFPTTQAQYEKIQGERIPNAISASPLQPGINEVSSTKF
jgi:hypothetical protein